MLKSFHNKYRIGDEFLPIVAELKLMSYSPDQTTDFKTMNPEFSRIFKPIESFCFCDKTKNK